jgi:hypothetical protein
LPRREEIVGKAGNDSEWHGVLPQLIRKLTVAKGETLEEVQKMRLTPVVFTT